MPARPARVTRARARADENQVPVASKCDVAAKTKKPARAPLADRTNSASDENTSGQVVHKKPVEVETSKRPRRNQRPPARFLEHQISSTPPRHKEASPVNIKVTPEPREETVSPFKTPKDGDISIVGQRPRRVQRLPSRFSDHSLSPSNFTALKPSWASTPLPAKDKVPQSRARSKRIPSKESKLNTDNTTVKPVTFSPVKKATVKSSNADNYTLEQDGQSKPVKETSRPRRAKRIPLNNISLQKTEQASESIPLPASPQKTRAIEKYVVDSLKNHSIFKSNTSSPKLHTKKKSKVQEKLSVYEFTFDPSEEPKIPNKKIKKQTVRRKAAPRRVYIKDNYSQNVEKQLQSLKSILSKKNVTTATQTDDEITAQLLKKKTTNNSDGTRIVNPQTITDNTKQVFSHKLATQTTGIHSAKQPIAFSTKNTAVVTSADPKTTSVTIPPNEVDYHDEFPISYSPVSTPRHEPEAYNRPSTSNEFHDVDPPNPAHNRDPLNLGSDLSFFDKVPVASSSILSTRKSADASPWRLDFEVHSKWPVNVYVKPNMTPAYESTFTNVEVDSNVKNTVKPATGLFTDQNESSGYKQTSILSFIKEVAEKKARKSLTPTKHNSVFDVSQSSNVASFHNPGSTPTKNVTPNNSKDSETSLLSGAINNPQNALVRPEKAKEKEVETKGVSEFFGFSDDEEDLDQENVSPQKKVTKPKSRRVLRSRAVLKELNAQKPTRLTTVPAKAFASSSAVVNEIYEKSKSVKEAPVEPELNMDSENSSGSEEKLESSSEVSKEVIEKIPSPSVHLFENCDLDVIHHQKPVRKSYGKARKVTFQQSTVTDMHLSDEEDDVTFTVPRVRDRRAPKRKKKKTQGMTAQEKQEAEKWAAGFQSMIEEAKDFPLIIE